ncbi:hypothetical protein FA13DRAFT_1730302 [Coprinellus micaceus]|uniref:Protein kinase domain-containing protein n=1 Tax=Coprinellus micaceus TaxID=71717 RepID=A0A4Y7TIJ3_COPMI|nr:hypothetical protein FA13DRAFT_1730302 [Coprinellus micaceus]
MSGSSKPDSSPIHDFVPSDDSSFERGDEVRVGDVLYLVHRVLMKHLPTPNPEETATKPSSHPQAKHYTSTRFKSPYFHLTKEVLETRIVVTRLLFSQLDGFSFIDSIGKYDEQSVTKNVVKPVVAILLAMFEARLPSHNTGCWIAEDCVKLENSVELDILIKRKGAPLPEGLAPELKGLQSTIEMKTPRSCNTPEISLFSKSPSMTTSATKEIRDQIGKQGSLLKKIHPDQDFVIHALSIAPAHLFPAASNGQRLAIGSDMLGLDGECPSVVMKSENWLEYIDKVGALIFAIMISEAWYDDCPGQRQQVQSLIDAAGKALQPTPFEVVLTFFWAVVWAIQATVSLPLLLVLTHLRWLNLTKTLKQPDVDRNSSGHLASFWRIPLGLTLFPPRSTHETAENIVYVYSRPKIRACYKRLIDLQGRPLFNRLSNAIHKRGLHHHDLHPRNVVRDSKGKLSIIDFGYGGTCTDAECTDDWKEWWAS